MVTNACDPSALPSGYALDKAHSGEVTSHSYSAAVDLQAALQYDELQSGAREIYLHRVASTKSKVDGVVSCVSLRFPSVDQAARFFGSFQTLRKQASAVVTKLHPAPHVKGLTGTTAYLEREQSFRGYGIASTDVLEIAGLEGSTLHIVSVGGAQPSKAVAVRIVRSGVSA
jgi:hypothetical protein